MIAILLTTWLLLSAFTTVACAAVARGGLREDRARGHLRDPLEVAPEGT
jgi:hypothetical protein